MERLSKSIHLLDLQLQSLGKLETDLRERKQQSDKTGRLFSAPRTRSVSVGRVITEPTLAGARSQTIRALGADS